MRITGRPWEKSLLEHLALDEEMLFRDTWMLSLVSLSVAEVVDF